MKLKEAMNLAKKMMAEHGLLNMGWQFGFDNSVRRFGCTHYRSKMITLSDRLTALNEEARVKNTILHEIAHALTPIDVGHGPAWVAQARAIGCDGQRCYDSNQVVTPKRPWQMNCENCGPLQAFRFKRIFNRIHTKCRGKIGWIPNKEA